MIEVKCTQCKLAMKKSDKPSDSGMDVYVCVSCGTKKQFPKKSEEKLLKEEQFTKLDNERAAQEGIMDKTRDKKPDQEEAASKPDEQKKDADDQNNEPPKVKKISSSKLKALNKEIETLKEEVNELKAKLEIKKFERDNLYKSVKKFIDEFSIIAGELNTSFNSRAKKLDDIAEKLKRKLK